MAVGRSVPCHPGHPELLVLPPTASSPGSDVRGSPKAAGCLVLEVTHHGRQDGRRPASLGRLWGCALGATWAVPPRPGNAAGWLPSQTSCVHLKVHSSFNELILHFCQESVVQICGFISVSLFCAMGPCASLCQRHAVLSAVGTHCLEAAHTDSSCLLFSFKIDFAILGPLPIHMQLRTVMANL